MWISLCLTTVFSQQGGISVFKFPKRFLEFSWTKTSLYSLLLQFLWYSNNLKTWLPNHLQCPSLMLRQGFSQFIRPTNFKTPSGDYDNWQVFSKNESRNNLRIHHVFGADCVLSFHKLQCIHFRCTSFKKPKEAKQDWFLFIRDDLEEQKFPCNRRSELKCFKSSDTRNKSLSALQRRQLRNYDSKSLAPF